LFAATCFTRINKHHFSIPQDDLRNHRVLHASLLQYKSIFERVAWGYERRAGPQLAAVRLCDEHFDRGGSRGAPLFV
jgi:hypothetical protein